MIIDKIMSLDNVTVLQDSSFVDCILGVQARTHIEAMNSVRKIKSLRLWNRTSEKAHQLASDIASLYSFKITVIDLESPEDAIKGADVICACTGSAEPVIRREWVKAGAHINAVGAYTA